MSTRMPFKFPGNQDRARSAAGIHFSPGPENLLDVSGKSSEQGESAQKETRYPTDAFASNAFRKPNGHAAAPTRPGTAGLGFLKKRASADTVKPTEPVEHAPIVRPGTANPYSRSFQAQAPNLTAPHPPLMAPTPQKATRISPSLTTQNGSFSGLSSSMIFKVPFPSASTVSSDPHLEKKAHISTSDVNAGIRSTPDQFPQDINFRPASRANGPQRVPIEQGPAMINRFGNNRQSPDAQDMAAEHTNPSFSPLRHARKRSRDNMGDDGREYESDNQPKRFKAHQGSPGQGQDPRKHTLSPSSTGRPSSGMSMSHSIATHEGSGRHDTPGSQRRPDLYSQYRSHPSNSPSDNKRYSPYGAAPPPPAALAPVPSALAKLLGTDPDDHVQNHMDEYDEMAHRWANCTIDEWKAGADEIAADYHKLLDHVKGYMDTKLKLYSSLHADIGAHNAVLEERKNALENAREKVLHESGDVLK